MYQKKKKNKIIYTDSDIKVSRFLLDLPGKFNEEIQKYKEKEDKKKRKINLRINLNSFYKKISSFNFRKKKEKKDDSYPIFSDYILPSPKDLLKVDKKEEIDNKKDIKKKEEKEEKEEYFNYNKKQEEKKKESRNVLVERLTFFPLFKLIYFFLKNIVLFISHFSYGLGWIIVFLFKFFVILFFRILKLFFKIAIKISFIGKIFVKRKKEKTEKINFAVKDKHLLFFKKERKKRKIKELFQKKNVKNKDKGRFNFKKISFRPIFSFFIILILFALPLKAFLYYKDLNLLKGRVLEASEKAISGMIQGTQEIKNKDFDKAEFRFNSAESNFLKAQDEVKDLSLFFKILGNLIPQKNIKLAGEADNILKAGVLSARIGVDLNDLFISFDEKDINLEEIIDSLDLKIKDIEKNILELNLIIEKINPDVLDKSYQDQFKEIKEKFLFLSGTITEISGLIDQIKVFSGFNEDKRYLLVFQNNTEMRGSGGFIGSYALADLRNGEIINLEIPKGGSYDTEGGLYEKIVSPDPLHLVNPLWHFWDANWWPDWEMSAKKLMWFYEKSGGSTVDGVISFTPTVIERMLKIIGPIDMREEYGEIINADNFWEITQKIVEEKPSKNASSTIPAIKNEPKKIIGDMMEKIISKIKKEISKEKFLKILSVLNESLEEKHIMFYFQDANLEKTAELFGWDGKIKNSYRDYLMVVNSNIAGAKSDKAIQEDINLKSEVEKDGTIINTLKIKRKHKALRGSEFIGVRNVDWMRIYVPLGSRLISFSGYKIPDKHYFEEPQEGWKLDEDVLANEGQALTDPNTKTKIYNEKNKTVFANWCMVDPGEEVEIIVKYKLPFKINLFSEKLDLKNKIEKYLNPNIKNLVPYSLLVQKQPGSLGDSFSSQLILSKNMEIVWSYPQDLRTNYYTLSMKDNLKTDKYYALALSFK